MVFNVDKLENDSSLSYVVGKFKGVSKSSGKEFFALHTLRKQNQDANHVGFECQTQFVDSETWQKLEIGKCFKRSISIT